MTSSLRRITRAFLTLVVLASPALAQGGAGQSVGVLVTAVDKQGKFVTTLAREDVRVLDGGVAREVTDLRRQSDAPLLLAVAVDTSASQEGVLAGSKLAADVFVRGMMRPGVDRAAVVTFALEPTLELGVTGDVQRVREAVAKIRLSMPPGYLGRGRIIASRRPPPPMPGATALWDAVRTVSSEVLTRSLGAGRRSLILITDGVDTASRVKMDEAVRGALRSEVVVYAVGVAGKDSDGVDKGALRKLSEQTGGRAFFPKKLDELPAIFAQIQEELLSQYVLTFTPAAARDGSPRKLSVELINAELSKQGVKLAYPRGYFSGDSPVAAPPRR